MSGVAAGRALMAQGRGECNKLVRGRTNGERVGGSSHRATRELPALRERSSRFGDGFARRRADYSLRENDLFGVAHLTESSTRADIADALPRTLGASRAAARARRRGLGESARRTNHYGGLTFHTQG